MIILNTAIVNTTKSFETCRLVWWPACPVYHYCHRPRSVKVISIICWSFLFPSLINTTLWRGGLLITRSGAILIDSKITLKFHFKLLADRCFLDIHLLRTFSWNLICGQSYRDKFEEKSLKWACAFPALIFLCSFFNLQRCILTKIY